MNTQTRWLLAFGLSALIYIGWFKIFPPPEAPPQLDEAAEVVDGKAQEESKESAETKAPAAPETPTPVADSAAESVDVVKTRLTSDLLALDVSNQSPHEEGIIRGMEMLSRQFRGHLTGSDAFSLEGTPTLEVSFADEQTDFRIPRGQNFEVREQSERRLVLGYAASDVEIVETLELQDGYSARLTVEVKSRAANVMAYRVKTRTRVGAGESRYDVRRGISRTGEDLEDETASDAEDGPIRFPGKIGWAASDAKYFTMAVVPTVPGTACVISAEADGARVVTTLESGLVEVQPGETSTHVYDLYIGAKELERLQAFQAGAPGLEEAIDWGYLGIVSGTLGPLLLRLLRWVHEFVHSWGWSILVLTVIVKLITLPLTLKQMASMKRMKEIQPEIAKIKAKYGDDRTKQGQEMQALFSRSGVNPLAGCLPMLVQLPVWFALYSMLLTAVELVHEPFLWLPDLTEADPFFITPVAMTGVMVLQNRMMPVTDETQAKLMRTIMPLMFGGMMLFLPAGLGVYIFTNVLLSAVQSAIQLRTTNDGGDTEAKPST